MKNNYDILIATTSWEERFNLGIEKNLTIHQAASCILLNNLSNPHLIETKGMIGQLYEKKLFEQILVHDVDFGSTLDIWNKLTSLFIKDSFYKKKILFDITTTPREIIWYVLYFLLENECEIEYIYHKPEKYTSDWLTKDPRKPRFIIKHSGISEFSKPTGLFILTGFDHNRTEQLINFYEPKLILLGVQENNQLDSISRNQQLHEKLIKQFKDNIIVFNINSYNEADCLDVIIKNIEPHIDKYNLIMSSLGPKVSAITLYKIFLKHPEIAIAYARSHEYNVNYSQGIGDYCTGTIS